MSEASSNSMINISETDLTQPENVDVKLEERAADQATDKDTQLQAPDLTDLLPPQALSPSDREIIFQHLYRRLASYYDSVIIFGEAELVFYGADLDAHGGEEEKELEGSMAQSKGELDVGKRRTEFEKEMCVWAEHAVQCLWLACFSNVQEKEKTQKEPPKFDPYTDTATRELADISPFINDAVPKILSTALFIQLTSTDNALNTSAYKGTYSAHTRTFFRHLSNESLLSSLPALEVIVSHTLRNPSQAVSNAQTALSEAESASAASRTFYRRAAYVLGGLFLGFTGGLSAPLIGAGVSTVLGALGVAGTSAGLIASGLAGSSAVCGTLFGVYGANKLSHVADRVQREVKDFEVVRVHGEGQGKPVGEGEDLGAGMAVRICVSGWVAQKEDVWQPWTVFGPEGAETFALQWEMEALEELSTALVHLLKAQTYRYLKKEILTRTLLATLVHGLSPLHYLRVTKVIDNPWLNARSLAFKTGRVLGILLAQRAFGARPVILTGYSLGSLVILSALSYLSTLPPVETTHLIQDVFLFGTPVSSKDHRLWSSARRIVSGRLVNGYCEEDYVLAIVARVSERSLNVAGLQGGVDVRGVENVKYDVGGHLAWRGVVGKCLEECKAEGLLPKEVERQVEEVGKPIQTEMENTNDASDHDEDTHEDSNVVQTPQEAHLRHDTDVSVRPA